MNNIEPRAGAEMPEKEKQILRALFQKQRDAQLRRATPAQTGRFLARLRQQKLRHAAFQWTRWALAASVFHDGLVFIAGLKASLAEAGIEVRR